MNQVVLMGRLAKIEAKEIEGKEVCDIVVAVKREYKNEDGIYETDFIECIVCGAIATSTLEYCKKGDLVAVKGRLEEKNGAIKIAVEKLSFLQKQEREV